MSAQSEHEARSAIRPVKEQAEDALIARDGVVAVDIGVKISNGKPTGELSIVVFVEAKKPDGDLKKSEAIPKEIDGVKTDVQELTIELQSAVRMEETVAQVDTTSYPTLSGGISMGPTRTVFLSPPDVPAPGNFVFVGTLGAMVRDRASGATMALTNFHVACVNNTWAVGNRMMQPSRVDGGVTPAGDFGSLTRATLSELVDGSVTTVDAGKAWEASVVGIGTVLGQGLASVGMAVQKRGRTTEHTFGNVVSTDFTVSINYGSDVGSHTLRHQIRIDTDTARSTRFSDRGDSGSVIMDNARNVVGLLFGGATNGSMTFANPIAAVLDELSVDLLIDRPSLVTRPVLCDFVVTKPVLCSDVLTKAAICNLVTRFTTCFVVTKPNLCLVTRAISCQVTRIGICEDLVTRSAGCLITRGGCTSRAVCGPGDFDPGRPIERPGRFADAEETDNDYGASDQLEDSFVAGYLAALEAVAAAEAESQAGQDS